MLDSKSFPACRSDKKEERQPSFRLARIVMLASLIPIGAGLAACKEETAAAAPQQAPPPPQVGVMVVAPQPVERKTELPGRIAAVLSADVRPQVTGIIQTRLFTEGSEVTQGQQLYQIDPAIYQAALDSATATLQHDEAALANARAKAERYETLLKTNTINRQDYEDAHAIALEAEANIAIARAAIQQAQINLLYTKVLSPIAGHIGRSAVTPGALVTANQPTALATVTQLDPIYVDLNQSSMTLLRLQEEMAAGQLERAGDGAAKVSLKLEDGTSYPLAGALQFTEVTVDAGTGTVLIRAKFPNPQHILLPGMYVHAEIEEGINRSAMLLPQQAVSHNSHGDPTVLLVGADNKVVVRTIQTGPAVGDKWVVTGGLKAGETVVVDGLQNAHPGGTVQPVTAEAATGGKSS
jgi:membrane fusion protein, multidrug efflux system